MNSETDRFVALTVCSGALIGTLLFIGFQTAVVLGLLLVVGLLFEIWAAVRAVEYEVWHAGDTTQDGDSDD